MMDWNCVRNPAARLMPSIVTSITRHAPPAFCRMRNSTFATFRGTPFFTPVHKTATPPSQ